MMQTHEIVFQTEEDANEVLTAMRSLLNQYEQVTLADMMELSGIASTFNDNKVGWTGLTSVSTKEIKDGYILDLPGAKQL